MAQTQIYFDTNIFITLMERESQRARQREFIFLYRAIQEWYVSLALAAERRAAGALGHLLACLAWSSRIQAEHSHAELKYRTTNLPLSKDHPLQRRPALAANAPCRMRLILPPW